MRMLLLVLLVLLGACDEGPRRAPEGPTAPRISEEYAHRFLVQHECEGGALPFEAACTHARPARAGALTYRRFDWTATQASDAVLREDGVILHTFDFGDGARAFGRLDRGMGDGGDLVRLTARGVGIEQTEDGGAGRQWWRDPHCHEGAGWLLFASEAGDGWQSEDGHLGLGRSAEECPGGHSTVHTRWRRVSYELPWTDGRMAGWIQRDAIVSEHYSGGPPEVADHMERFVFAAGLGKVVWERWEHRERTSRTAEDLALHEAVMRGDGRCPIGADAPGEGWMRADCRVWMRFQRGAAQSLPWP